MPKITSPLTNKNIQTNPYREFEVQDATDITEPSSPFIDFVAIDAHRIKRGLPPLEENIKQEMVRQMQTQQRLNTAQTFTSTTEEDEMTVDKLAEIEKKLQVAKQARANNAEKLTAAAKSRIEALLGMSKSVKETDIDGNKYTLRALKGKEQRAAIVAAAEFDGTAHAAFEIRKQLLARCIMTVNGTDLELYLGSVKLEARLEFIDELEEPMLIKLYSEYLDLMQEIQNRYFIKNEQEAKEVVEDLKK